MSRLSREDLIEVARRLINSDFESEEEADAAVEQLTSNVPDPNVTDYIFWADPPDEDPDPVEVVDRALAYQPDK